MTTLLIAGTRTFTDYNKLSRELTRHLTQPPQLIIHGGARGADALAARWANEHNIPQQVHTAQWDTHGKKAGFIRNEEMHRALAEHEDRLAIIFWDGVSPGTGHSVKLAERYKNPLVIVRI